MNEKPILFSGEMVRAILDGRKTQTRRVVKPQPPDGWGGKSSKIALATHCPYGQPGMTLWVRETWASHFHMDDTKPSEFSIGAQMLPVWYRATDDNSTWRERGKWRPSIFMPRWATRITLQVTGVRVERVQDISEADAVAEGIERKGEIWKCCEYAGAHCYGTNDPTVSFSKLWDSINGARPGCAWSDNPWVWVVEFEVTHG
jgi:hypothetical protein